MVSLYFFCQSSKSKGSTCIRMSSPSSEVASSCPKYLQDYCVKLKLICKSDWQLTTVHISPVAFGNSSEAIYCTRKLSLLMKIAFKL